MSGNGQILRPGKRKFDIQGVMGGNAQVAVAMLPGPKMLMVGGESKLHAMTRAVVSGMDWPLSTSQDLKEKTVTEAVDFAGMLVAECDRRMVGG